MKKLKPVVSMRDVVALANGATVDKVSGYTFRSAEEVSTFLTHLDSKLKGLTDKLLGMQRQFAALDQRVPALSAVLAAPISIDRGDGIAKDSKRLDNKVGDVGKIVIDNIGKLKDNFQLLMEINDKLEVLDTLEAQAAHALRGENAKILAAIKATKTQYEKKLKSAMNFLKAVAKKHEPPKFKAMVEGVMNYFHSGFDNKFDKAEEHVFVTVKTEKGADDKDYQVLVFNHYVQFTNLKNEHIEYTYPKYIVVFTAVVDAKGQMRMYVNTLHKFRAPGTFKYGHSFSDLKGGVSSLSGLFETDDFVDLLDRQPVPMADGKVNVKNFRSIEYIKDTKVENNTVFIQFNGKVTKENVQKVAIGVLADVRGLFSGYMKTQLRYKIVPPAKGMEFILTLPTNVDTTKFITQEKQDLLKEHLGFDDKDMAQIIKLFNKGHV